MFTHLRQMLPPTDEKHFHPHVSLCYLMINDNKSTLTLNPELMSLLDPRVPLLTSPGISNNVPDIQYIIIVFHTCSVSKDKTISQSQKSVLFREQQTVLYTCVLYRTVLHSRHSHPHDTASAAFPVTKCHVMAYFPHQSLHLLM